MALIAIAPIEILCHVQTFYVIDPIIGKILGFHVLI